MTGSYKDKDNQNKMDKTPGNNNHLTLKLEDYECSTFTINDDDKPSNRSSLMSINFPSDFQKDDVSKEEKSVIIRSIQMGLEHSLTKGIGSTVECDVLFKDFKTVEVTVFNCDKVGHGLKPFTFKSYAPVAFRHFRTKFGIEQEDYLTSFCNFPLRELSNPGASGSMFFITQDDEFIMKTINHCERKFLSDLLPGYLMNLNQNPYSLLPKFFGFYCYKFGKNYNRFVAMNNFIPSDIKIYQRYDLKGSTHKRFASKIEKKKISPTYKDLDFKEHHPNGIFLEPATHKLLIKTINRDCRVLESFKIMDYSLLLGVHNVDLFEKEQKERRAYRSQENMENGTDTTVGTSSTLSRISETDKDDLVDNPSTMDSANAKNYSDKDFILSRNGIPATSGNGEKLLLFIGIIDILESYGAKKKLELRVKSLLNESSTISTQKPSFYASRFLNFIETNVLKKIESSRVSSASCSSGPNPRLHSDLKRSVSTNSKTSKYDSDGFIRLDFDFLNDFIKNQENSSG